MFINKLQLKNFKRFTDLTVDLAPQPPKGVANQEDENLPKLVLLIGANGSGKSCIFDAFESANAIISDEKLRQAREGLAQKKKGYLTGLGLPDNDYCSKKKDVKDKNGYELIIDFDKEKYFNFHYKSTSETNIVGESSLDTNLEVGNYFYGRTAFRNIIDLETKFNADEYGEKDVQKVVEKNLDKPSRLIDLDKRWDGDILYCFKEEIDRKELTIELNKSLNHIFEKNPIGHFQIESIRSEIGRSIKLSLEVLIKKGNSIFVYEYLSAGEKQLFTILLNLHLRKKYLENTIIYLDEIDLHLNTSIQSDLLKEITETLIPDNSQVWVASHSLGFIDYARQYKKGVIIDFDSLDFDIQKILTPESRDRLEVYEIAVPKSIIPSLMKRYKLVIAENTNAKYFNLALEEQNYLFLPANNNREVFLSIKEDKNKIGLRDKDYLREDEIKSIQEKFPNFKILNLYNFENYIYHPDNINELKIKGFDKTEYIQNITEQKNNTILTIVSEINEARGHYVEFKDFIKNDKEIETIIEALKSNNFDDLYTFFNMKKYFNRDYLKNYQLPVQQLSATNWFKTKISEVLK